MDLFSAFAVGISFSATFITLVYLAFAHDYAGQPDDVNLPYIAVLSRLGYGFGNMLNVLLGNSIQSAAFSGSALGLIFSLIGRFKLNLPSRIFKMEKDDEWKVHLIAPIMYATIFVLLIRNLNLKLNIG